MPYWHNSCRFLDRTVRETASTFRIVNENVKRPINKILEKFSLLEITDSFTVLLPLTNLYVSGCLEFLLPCCLLLAELYSKLLIHRIIQLSIFVMGYRYRVKLTQRRTTQCDE